MSPVLLGAGHDIHRAKVLVLDYFTDANGTTPPNHVPNIRPAGVVYEDAVAGATIEGNRLSDNSGDRIVVINSGRANVIVRSRLTVQGGNFFGFVFRYQDATHYLIGGCDIGLNKVAIWQNNAGWTEIGGNANGSRVFNDGDIVDLEVRTQGSSIQVFINGLLGASTTSALFLTETRHGFYVDGNSWSTDGFYDNLQILAN